MAALLDMQQNGDIQSQEEPVILLELGSGSGVLAWLLLQALTECLSSGVRLPHLLLVLSDVAASNVAAMQEPRAGFCEWFQTAEAAYGPTGPLETCAALPALAVDWAIVDCAKGATDLHLQRSQWHIQEGTLQNPLVLIGTYLLDSLPQDAFRCVGGQLSALWLDVGGVHAEEGQPTAQGLHESGDVTLEWVDVPLPEATHAALQAHFASYEVRALLLSVHTCLSSRSVQQSSLALHRSRWHRRLQVRCAHCCNGIRTTTSMTTARTLPTQRQERHVAKGRLTPPAPLAQLCLAKARPRRERAQSLHTTVMGRQCRHLHFLSLAAPARASPCQWRPCELCKPRAN